MSLVTLQGFTNFVNSTSTAKVDAEKERLNEAVIQNYLYYGLLAGKGGKDYLCGGSSITRQIKFSSTSQSETRKPLQDTNYAVEQGGVDMTVYWREWHTPAAIAEQTLIYNESDHLDGMGRFIAWYDTYLNAYQDMCTDQVNFGEYLALRRPDVAAMENSGGKDPYCLHALVNEFDNGLTGSGVDAQGTAWTQVQGLVPSAYPETNPSPGYTSANTSLWSNLRVGYKNLQADDKDNLINALATAMAKLDYRPPQSLPGKERFFQWTKPTDFIGVCSLAGILALQRQYRRQGMWVNTENFELTPRFGPWQFVYSSKLDNLAVYPTGSAAAIATATAGVETDTTNTTATNAGPRFMLLNRSGKNGVHMMFHRDGFMKSRVFPAGSDPRQYDAIKMVVNNKGNVYRTSGRRAGAMLVPTSNITD